MKRLMPNQQSLAEAAARVAKRQWHWCRRPNGFSDKPLWRVVAAKANVPLSEVIALVNKLEEIANDAGNHGHSRGSVADFSAATFGMALDIPADHAAKIFSALQDEGWVSFDHIADFYERNKDREDDGAAGRQRRSRAFKRALQDLVKQRRAGAFDVAEFELRQRELIVLKAGHAQFEEADLYREIHRLVFGAGVVHMSHLSQRDSVTVTPEKSRYLEARSVDNNGGSVRGEAKAASEKGSGIAASLSTGHDVTAEQWITSDGVMLVVERMQVVRIRAETLIARWLRDIDGELDADRAGVLKAIIEDAAIQTSRPAHFLVIVTDQLRRHREAAQGGQRLPLGPTLIGNVKKASNG